MATSRRRCSPPPRTPPASTCCGGSAGLPRACISAAAIKCLGGRILGRLWPRDDDERQAAIDAGYDLDRVLDTRRPGQRRGRLLRGTGVTDGDLLAGRSQSRRRPRDDRVAGHALALRHGADGQGTPRPPEAARGHRRALRIAGAGARRAGPCRRRPADRRRHGLHRRPRSRSRICSLTAVTVRAHGARSLPRCRTSQRAGAEVVEADVLLAGRRWRPRSTASTVAYYLVHSMGRGAASRDFAARDRAAATNFGSAARAAGVEQIVYLGGLAEGGSEHLREPPRDGRGAARVGRSDHLLPAAAVIGAGSESFRTVDLSGQAPAGDGDAELDPHADAADRDRRRRRLSRRRARGSRRRAAARSRSADPTSRPTAG